MADSKKVKESKTTEKASSNIDNQEEQPIEPPARKSTKEATAKAGKRSAKAVAEQEEKVEKEARKAEVKSEKTEEKPKQPVKPARSRLERRGKKYREAAKLIDSAKLYSMHEAIELVIKTNPAKFDATVELHARLGVDPRQADQNLRDNVVLPAGTGKSVRVAVFADEEVANEAKKVGADIVGSDDFLAQLDKGTIDFDVLIATPSVMARLSKYARILGPKGLMPNPKSGTVTTDVKKAIEQAKAGKVEYRVDSTAIIHVGVGKISFGVEKLTQNISAITDSIKQNKPSSIKGTYVKSITLTSSMGPGIKVSASEI